MYRLENISPRKPLEVELQTLEVQRYYDVEFFKINFLKKKKFRNTVKWFAARTGITGFLVTGQRYNFLITIYLYV